MGLTIPYWGSPENSNLDVPLIPVNFPMLSEAMQICLDEYCF